MKWIIAVLFVCVLFVPPVEATGCRAVVRKNVIVQEKIVVAQVVPVVAQFLQIPLYSAVYTPAYTQPQQGDDLASAVKQLALEVGELRKVVRGGTPTMPPADEEPVKPKKPVDPFNPNGPQALKTNNDVERLFSVKCAACHDASISRTKGNDFTMFNSGRMVQLDTRAALKIAAKTYSGEMPKGGKGLTDQEQALIMAWINTVE